MGVVVLKRLEEAAADGDTIYAVIQGFAKAGLLALTIPKAYGGLGLSANAAADVFAEWNGAELESFLVEITASVLRVADPRARDGAPLVDAILDSAGQKGTGRWTARAALELAVAAPTIAATAIRAENRNALIVFIAGRLAVPLRHSAARPPATEPKLESAPASVKPPDRADARQIDP